MPERVTLQGISGSGKSTLGREISRRLDMPYLEVDGLVHGPNWSEISDDALREHLMEFTAGERWVIDGDYRRKVGSLVLDRADTVVWLDLPLHVTLRRLWNRTARRITGDEQLWNGNAEAWKTALWGWESLFVFALRKHVALRRTLLHELPPHLTVVRLRSPEAVERWMNEQAPVTDA